MFEGKLKAVTFSFDDGVTQDIKLIQLLNKYNLKSTFNLNSGLLGKSGTLFRENQLISHYKVFPSDVKKVYEGHEVAVHTLTHLDMRKHFSEEELIRQIEQDRINLENLVEYDIVGMAYPGGIINNYIVEIIKTKTKMKYARTVTNTNGFGIQKNLFEFHPNVNGILDNNRLMELAEKFIETDAKGPMILYVWGHSYELDYYSDRIVQFEKFLKFISNRQDVFYGTNREVLLS